VADRLRLSSDSVALLLQGSGRGGAPGNARPGPRGPDPRGAYTQRELAQRLLSSEAVLEREFLVAAACNPSRAAQLLEALSPEHFADPSNREVFAGLRDALAPAENADDGHTAVSRLKAKAHGDSEAGRFFVRLVMEADQGRYAPPVLEELHLRLQEQYLKREIRGLREGLEQGGDTEGKQRRLFRLEQLLQAVRANLTNLDPEEGQI